MAFLDSLRIRPSDSPERGEDLFCAPSPLAAMAGLFCQAADSFPSNLSCSPAHFLPLTTSSPQTGKGNNREFFCWKFPLLGGGQEWCDSDPFGMVEKISDHTSAGGGEG